VLEPRSPLDDDGLDELVGDAGVVARLHRRDRVGRVHALSCGDRVEGALRAIPTLIAIHRVVAPGDGRDAFDRKLGEVVDGRSR